MVTKASLSMTRKAAAKATTTVKTRKMSFSQKHCQNYFPKHVILNFVKKNPREFILSQLRDVNSGAQKNINLKNFEATPPSSKQRLKLREWTRQNYKEKTWAEKYQRGQNFALGLPQRLWGKKMV